MFETSKCNSCHEGSADQDRVFTQYYPVLRAADPENRELQRTSKKMDAEAQDTADKMLGQAADEAVDSDYTDRLFAWLQAGDYRTFKAESKVHVSAARAAHRRGADVCE